MVGFVLIQDTQPSTPRGEVRGACGGPIRPGGPATVDRQSLTGHEGLSHQVEIVLGNLLRVLSLARRQAPAKLHTFLEFIHHIAREA
jgi:hypothetical protein